MVHQLRLNLKLAKKVRQTLLVLVIAQKNVWCRVKKKKKDILVLQAASTAGFTPHPKKPALECQKNHLLHLKRNNLAQNPFALTWPELPLAPCCCFHSCALAQNPGMAADTSGSHPWHPGLEWEPGEPRFGVGGRFWQVPSDPKAPWARSIPKMLPGREAAWTEPPSVPQNLLFPILLKSIFHCFPRIKQAPTAHQACRE